MVASLTSYELATREHAMTGNYVAVGWWSANAPESMFQQDFVCFRRAFCRFSIVGTSANNQLFRKLTIAEINCIK
jgi:hypothetical protein